MTRCYFDRGTRGGDVLEIAHEHRGAARRKERLKALLTQTQAALSEHQGALAASEEARRRLEIILGESRRDRFGAKSEKLRPDQYHLPLEDVEIAQGILDAAGESRGGDPGPITERARSWFSSQSRLLACPFAAGGADY
ncbi:transposase [Bradyrhizobium brasilense]|uniref:transposase n=1 Tax=Bradyrhizobium brasilense TaxID=1419277 RepID=UPI001E3D9C4F|nr:transposase [Bradyrhizobium brasilense]